MRFKTGRQKDHEVDVQKGIEQGIEQGIALKDLDVVERMLAKGSDWEFITQITELNREGFEALKAKYGK